MSEKGLTEGVEASHHKRRSSTSEKESSQRASRRVSEAELDEFRNIFARDDHTSIRLDHILKSQVDDMKTVIVEVADGYETDDDDDEDSTKNPSCMDICCQYAFTSVFNLTLLFFGGGILIAGLTIWLEKDDNPNTQERYQSAILFALSGLFIYPVLVKVFLGIVLYAYEGLLQWKRFAALSGVQEIHLYCTMVFTQIVQFVYILLDLITFAILKAILSTATNEELCSNVSQCGIQVIKDALDFVVRIFIVLAI